MFTASRPPVRLVAIVVSFASVSFVSFVSSVSRASAQPADVIGVRAMGMGGAFTAVADDATASWWNPAGIAGGAYFNALLEAGTHREPPTDRTSAGDSRSAWRDDTRSLAVSFPALALSYYRLRISDTQPQNSTGTAGGSRQEGGAAEVRLRSLVLNQFGASVGQSLGSHLVVASTLKLVNGGAVSQVQAAAGNSLDAATGLGPSDETHAGLDVGAMAVLGRVRFGLMVRNVTEPEFGSGPDAFTLSRQARVGAALTSGARGVIGSATLAIDADLTRTATVLGDDRRLALGGEAWTAGRRVGIRGGFSVNTVADRRAALSGGASVAVRRGLYADGELTGGSDEARRGWAAGLRVTF
jgi:hypothetical protein